MVESFRNRNPSYANVETYFTYAVHCVVAKPSIKSIRCCSEILKEKLVSNSDPEKPIMVFAFGPIVLKALGFNFKKHSDIVGQMLETTIGGRHVYVFASISLAQMVVKSGYVELVNRHIQSFMGSVLLNNMKKTLKTRANVAAISKNYVFPKTIQEVNDLVDHVIAYAPEGVNPENHLIAFDTETNTLMPHRSKLKMLTLTVAWDVGKAASIPVEHKESKWTLEDVKPALVRLLTCKKPKVGHNVKYDVKVLRRKKFSITRLAWDTMVGEHLLAEDKKGFYGLKELVKNYVPSYANYEREVKTHANAALSEKKKELKASGKKLSKAEESLLKDDGYADVPLDELNIYGAIDADATWQIAVAQRKLMGVESKKFLEARKKLQKFERAEFRKMGEILCPVIEPLTRIMATRTMPTLGVLARMEDRGVPMDRKYTEELAVKMEQSSREAIIKLNQMLPSGYTEKLNPASSGQIRTILYNLGFIHPETKEHVCYMGKVEPPRTDSGMISTNAQFLRLLVTKYDCPFSRDLLEFRAMQKARNTFIENIMVLTREDDRMHTTYHQHGTSSGRLCVSENTLLNTNKGTFKISNLDLSKVQNVSILTHTGKWQQIEEVYYKGEEEMYRVELENGSSIEVTANHRFFTKEGFQRLKNLTYGSEVITHTTSPASGELRRNHTGRKGIRTPLLGRVAHRETVSGFRSVVQNSQQLCSLLQREVRYTNKGTKVPHVLNSLERKYSRSKRTAWSCDSTRKTTRMCGPWVQLLHDSKSPRCECLVCTPEHEGVWNGYREKANLQTLCFRPRAAGRARTVFTRFNAFSRTVLQRPTRVLRKAIRGFFASYRADLVYKRTSQEPQSVPRARASKTRPHLLELKPARDVAVHGVNSRENTACSPGGFLQKLPSRLWVSRQQTSRGSRRKFPHVGKYQGQRRFQTERSCKAGIQDFAVYNQGSRKELIASSHCNTFSVSRIVKVTPLGVMGVWDISVGTDHSYVAHGFVNHNSSSHENMQNIPKKLGGHNIKKIFVPSRPGYAFGNADAKAAEVRLYSAYSKDANLIKALNDGMDPHSFFASMVYNPANVLNGVERSRWKEVTETVGIDIDHPWTYDDFCARDILKETEAPYGKQLDRLRGIIKRVVFGILYGATPNKVSSIVGIPEEQAAVIVDTLFKMFPTIPAYIQLTKDQLKHLGFVETFFGRRRRFGELHKLPWGLRSKAERQSVNFKIQSTSSEIVLEVLCDMEEPLRVDMQGELLLTVHDSVGFECPDKYVHQLPEFIKEYGMRRINNRYPWLPVPFSWDVEAGPSYGELMSIDNYVKKMENVTHIVPENPADRDDFIEQEVRAEFEELITS
jgi:DNA polymerase I-like protein with 3'-5' exonuclease and polymerase domains